MQAGGTNRKRAVTLSRGLSAATMFAAMFAATFGDLRMFGRAGQPHLLWPESALAVVLLLREREGGWVRRQVLLAIAGAGFLLGAVAAGRPLEMSAALSVVECVGVGLCCRLLADGCKSFAGLKRRAAMLRFVLTTTAVPLVLGLLRAALLARLMGQPFVATAGTSALAESIGLLVVVPPGLWVLQGPRWMAQRLRRPPNRQAQCAQVLFLLVTSWIFWQNHGPFLFMTFPPLVLLVMTIGLEGAAFAALTLPVIAWTGTRLGHGPIWLMHGTPLERMTALQAFVWVCLITALPIGAMFDERRRAKRELAAAFAGMTASLEDNRRLLADLQASHTLFAAFMSHGPFASYIKDADGSMVFYNRFLAEMCKVSEQAWLGLKDDEIWPPEMAAEYRRHDVEVLRSGRSWEGEDVSPGPNGERVFWKTLKFPYFDAAKQKLMLAGVSFDVTEAVLREAALEDALREKATLVRRIEESHQSLEQSNERLTLLATTDSLTGLATRRVFEARAASEFALARRQGRTMSMLAMDIDDFKRRNDRYGHAAGDAALKVLAEVVQAAVRDGDLAARLGGEEFAVLLPDTGADGAMELAGRLQKRLAAAEHGPVVLTVSIGVATAAVSSDGWSEVLAQADAAMYKAKRMGKNRVQRASGTPAAMAATSTPALLRTGGREGFAAARASSEAA